MSLEQFAERGSWISVLLEPATSLSSDDLDAIEANGWSVAGENAYPLVLKVTPPERLSSPGLAEVAWLAAALRVLPDFVAKKMRPERGYPNSAEATYSLPDVHGNQQIALRFPAEEEEEEWDEEDWELEDEDEEEEEEEDEEWDEEDDGEAELEEFIADWYWDEASHQFCREMGAFLFAFIDDLIENANLSERTIQKHIDNCWAIGNLTASYGSYDTFSPKIFLSGPSYLYEFKRKYSGSKSALSSYQATWRKLEKYARSLDYED